MTSSFFRKSEYQGLNHLYKASPRNPKQLNRFNSSDTEQVHTLKAPYLTVSTDSIAIEIHTGLYKNPETWGYLAAVNSISDLSTSGSTPIGLQVSAQWKSSHQNKVRQQVFKSLSFALRKFRVPLMGGDSGSSKETVLTTTILGQSSIRPLSRLGVRRGDYVLLFGKKLGFGPALAFDFLFHKGKNRWEEMFRPEPHWQTTHKFQKYFHAAIDTSDGVYNALHTLSQLNQVSFEIDLESITLVKTLADFAQRYSLPKEYFIESDLGDLQTCVSLSPDNYRKIKTKLPPHFLVAVAGKTFSKTPQVKYKNRKLTLSLPSILENSKMNYTLSIKKWLSQHKTAPDSI